MTRKPRSEAPSPSCAICYGPRVFNSRLSVYVCRVCEPDKASDGETRDPEVTLYRGVKVDST